MKIALVTDTHLSASAPVFDQSWETLKTWLNASDVEAVVHLGDISADAQIREEDLDHARARFDGLVPPVRFIPGNHDLGDNPPAPGQPLHGPGVTAERLDAYRRRFGDDRWQWQVAGFQIIALNAQLMGTGLAAEAAQWAWLEEVVAACDRPLGLFLHKPLFRDDPQEDAPHIRYVPRAARLRLTALLAGRDWRFACAGHAHQAVRHRLGPVDLAWIPSAAFCLPNALQEEIGEKVVGIGLLTLADGHHSLDIGNPAGLPRLNILDHPGPYPKLEAVRARLSPEAASLP